MDHLGIIYIKHKTIVNIHVRPDKTPIVPSEGFWQTLARLDWALSMWFPQKWFGPCGSCEAELKSQSQEAHRLTEKCDLVDTLQPPVSVKSLHPQ